MNIQLFNGKRKYPLLVLAALFASAMYLGCEGDTGPAGPPGSNSATLSGVVTNSATDTPIEGVEITTEPGIQSDIVTDASGGYSVTLPDGVYTVKYAKDNFVTTSQTVTLINDTDVDVALVPSSPVVVNAGADLSGAPGDTVNPSVTIEILDGSTQTGILWEQTSSVTVTINDADTENPTVTLPGDDSYKEELIKVLKEPPIAEEDLPPNIDLPEGEFVGGLQDRFQVVGIVPFALEEAGLVKLKVTVTTSSGTYHDEVEIHATLPWKTATGIQSVPVGTPVLMHGKDQSSYDWDLTAPAGSAAALDDGSAQSPSFTPDVSGKYSLTVTDEATSSPVTIDVYAGTWEGLISGQEADGRPSWNSSGSSLVCEVCHFEGNNFTPPAPVEQYDQWRLTGHAEIFTVNLNTSTHYGESCFPCHTVGFDKGVNNGGIDDAADYANFLGAGLINNPSPDNWTTTLRDFDQTAQLANIQCENCHGPQNGTTLHFNGIAADPERESLASELCGSCHGEPLRHGRFQQWQLSRHANYELAIDEGEDGNCSRCHTANGFLAWGEQFNWDDTELAEPLPWTADEVHPQTCITCHDPHAIGTTSGEGTDATTRIFDNTPVLAAGWQAFGVGNGAICMTCHNTRRGLRNDAQPYPPLSNGSFDAARAPHGGAQGDLVMGQNAYFIQVGIRGSHSFITDTCVNCHMVQTPPPDLLSYNQSGSNHTFFASDDICENCHGDAFTADGVQAAFRASLDEVQDLMEAAILDLIAAQIAAGNTIDLNGDRVITDAAEIAEIVFGETRGRHAITVTFTDLEVVGPVRLSDVDVVDGSSAVLGELYEFADERVPKAGWNWNLVSNDGSQGIHNPDFALQVLDSARDALNALSSAP